MLSVTNYSYIVVAPPFLLHPLAPLKLDTGRPRTSRADTVPE